MTKTGNRWNRKIDKKYYNTEQIMCHNFVNSYTLIYLTTTPVISLTFTRNKIL